MPITLQKKDGTVLELFPATDSCDNYKVGDKIYDWGSNDYSEFWGLLDLEVRKGEVIRKNYYVSDFNIKNLIRVSNHGGKEFQKYGYIVLRDEGFVYIYNETQKNLYKIADLADYSFDSKRGDTVEVDSEGRLLEITVDGHTKVCGLFVEASK